MRIGVLALQGDVREHIDTLTKLSCETVEIRNPDQLQGLDGLILPGGESTTISKLLDIFDLRNPVLDFINTGHAVFGTCAGMISLAKEVIDSDWSMSIWAIFCNLLLPLNKFRLCIKIPEFLLKWKEFYGIRPEIKAF